MGYGTKKNMDFNTIVVFSIIQTYSIRIMYIGKEK